MRKISCSILLLAFVWSILGNFLSLEIQLNSARKEVKFKLKNGVPESERVVFTFSEEYCTSNLVWVKPNEFRLGNRFYDVIESRTVEGNKRRMECISDIQETKLFAELNSALGQELTENQSKNLPIKLIGYTIFSPYLLPESGIELKLNDFPTSQEMGEIQFKKHSVKHVSFDSPPPKRSAFV